jgi:uncharacterized tellurite resistance protein B-like protein
MTSLEKLYYAMGEMAYAIAMADGEVQKAERQKFHDIVASELASGHAAFDISEIIFQVLDKEKQSSELAYEWAMKQIRLNSHYLSPELKNKFIIVSDKIARAFLPVTGSEHALVERFRKDIEPLKGDPVYYNQQTR